MSVTPESRISMTPQSPESVEDCRPKKWKRAENETPRKRTRVSDVARPSISCQDQIKTVMRTKRKITKGEGHSLPAKKKKGLPEHILTTQSSSSTVDITTGWMFTDSYSEKKSFYLLFFTIMCYFVLYIT
ncbi:hypothetical protein AMECASPLE_006068 [Ameca splendens]|uniref:Uncharacterized protein n=1 Tax=Ameca splendens TaxID=208324 RepID=A0ABV0XNE0_9TELE